MTVVISDTSPINYLVLISEIGLLPALYGKVLIPDTVLAELLDAGSPPTVLAWATILPDWVEVVMDDAGGRAENVRRGFRITGTLGVLRAAALRHLVDIDSAVEVLSRTNFYLPPKLVAFLLAEQRDRKGR
jgi:predicted nucleic acid-binding protein